MDILMAKPKKWQMRLIGAIQNIELGVDTKVDRDIVESTGVFLSSYRRWYGIDIQDLVTDLGLQEEYFNE